MFKGRRIRLIWTSYNGGLYPPQNTAKTPSSLIVRWGGTLDLFGVAKSLTERLFRMPELLDFECLQ